ncbi:MAG: thiamine-phosphate pyrophosphorylase [Nitrospirae bacterium]|nr:thiamine-phosphate pyrophosphorylase [Nitrospirota bacterium]MBS1234393.1 thiamine-phosphate pyrophosphorylase [Nitrospirota bacterium]
MYCKGICFITDAKCTDLPLYDMVHHVLRAGVRCIQYREKDLSRRQIYDNAVTLRKLTGRFDAILLINDHADIALAVDADGVHLGQDDLPLRVARKIMGSKIVGISTHNLDQATEAERGGADYIGFGPVFHTTTKDAGAPKGVDNIRTIKENVSIPVVAIGGIRLDNIAAVIHAGADAAAVATAICKGDIAANAEKFVRFFNHNY